MNRRRNLVPSEGVETPEPVEEIGTNGDAYETSAEEAYEEQYWEDEPARPRGRWIVPTLAVIAALGWTGFFGWVNQQAILAGATPAQWLDWIVQWSVPLVLIVGLYLLAMRNSRREADRFADAARALAHESAQLESRLLVVNRELALARDFLASQSQDLESLGRLASERIATNADRLQSLMHDNSTQVETIGRVGETAVANMETLRDQLPVLASAARDMNNQIGNAGNSAQDQVNALVAAFERLNSFGQASETQVSNINHQVETTLTGFEEQLVALGELATQRIASLRADGERLTSAMDSGQETASQRWSQAIDALERRIRQVLDEVAALEETTTSNAHMRLTTLQDEAQKIDHGLTESANAFDEDFARRREANAARETEAMAALEARIAEFDQRIAERQEEHLAHVAGLAERGEALATRLTSLDSDMQQLGALADNTRGDLSSAADALAERLSQNRALLEDSGEFLTRLTDDSVRLLDIIRSSADHSSGTLSDSVASAEQRLSAFGSTARELHGLITDAETRGINLSAQLEEARGKGSASLEQMRALEDQLTTVAVETEQVAERTSQELREAIELLSSTSATVLETLRTDQTAAVNTLAEQIASASRDRLAEAMQQHAEEAIAELETATGRAGDAGRETAQLLRDQLAKVAELATNLEARVEQARERAQQNVDGDFSRRSVLITEALHSAAIDITKAFDNDVADTQWANYLRGDRGIFTRRAVRLLDKQEARAIGDFYNEDSEFRLVVNRYIHDFEAMLREVLATRDGHAMAVTLLSSDMGKLYVMLAQAIERLRS